MALPTRTQRSARRLALVVSVIIERLQQSARERGLASRGQDADAVVGDAALIREHGGLWHRQHDLLCREDVEGDEAEPTDRWVCRIGAALCRVVPRWRVAY